MNDSKIQEGFSAGKILKEKYVIDQPIGGGAMGLVYLAHDVNNARHRFVVKTLKRKALENAYAVQHFQQEGEALGRINHDGVIKLFDQGEDEETRLPFLVIEFAEGKTLTEIIRREPMSFVRCADLLQKIAYALTAVHKTDVLHRDLKPDNIIVVESDYEKDKIKIIDFGVAVVRDSIHAPTTVYADKKFVGTPAYASPEQLDKMETPVGEVFSLATIAYEMMTGKMAFPASNAAEAASKHLDGLQKPTELRADLPPKAEKVLLRGLAINPRERYQTPVEFADALIESLSPVRQNPVWLLPVAALFLLLTLGSLGYFLWDYFAGSPAATSAGNSPQPVPSIKNANSPTTTESGANESNSERGNNNTSTESASPSPANSSDSGEKPPVLSPAEALSVGLTLQRDKKQSRVDTSEIFVKNDGVRLNVSAAEKGYLFVFYKGSDGEERFIFPNKDYFDGKNEVEPNKTIIIPNEGWFFLDEKIGTETLFVIYSRTQNLSEYTADAQRAVKSFEKLRSEKNNAEAFATAENNLVRVVELKHK